MDCYCYSHQLYSQEEKASFIVDGKQTSERRVICNHQLSSSDMKLFDSILQSSSIYHSNTIEKVSINEIGENKLWFYKNFIAKNRPCIIQDVTQGQQISEQWSNPSDFKNITKQQISISLTPDGFADSLKNEYFVEPYSMKGSIQNLIDWSDEEKEGKIGKNMIPYIQHQNSNLTKELPALKEGINQETLKLLKDSFFEGSAPDAQNFWMGYKNSVSAIHKDPYENFYTVLVGQKHFTLLPPISILYLHEDSYKNGKWEMKNGNLEVNTKKEKEYENTRWISNNPDLKGDYKMFPQMEKLSEFYIHALVESGEMLYLPSLWYHQVAQSHPHDPYLIAINYWFDMQFNQNYSLYESCRKLKGYSV